MEKLDVANGKVDSKFVDDEEKGEAVEKLGNYKYRGIRALVLLHEQHLRSFLEVWKRAKAANIALPETEDDNYASLDTLLQHVLGAAAWYMKTICEVLELPDPELKSPPEVETVQAEADAYVKHVLERWRVPLTNLTEEQCYEPVFTTHEGGKLDLECKLEHAVTHPMRHQFQLEELLEQHQV